MRKWYSYLASLAALCLVFSWPSAEASAAVRNPDGVAVIIGNRNYDHTKRVDFAHRDAAAFRDYVVDILGFDPEKVIMLIDKPAKAIEDVFGNERTFKGALWRRLDVGGDVVVFYSGHGAPGMNTKRGYLVPVDTKPEDVELSGYPIDLLTANLGKLKARSVTVYIDACFSGDSHKGMLFDRVSSMRVDAPLPEELGEKLTMLTASQSKEVAWWDEKARHGLFTRHLLDALYGAGDGNKDSRVTAGEAKSYLDRHMTPAARRMGRQQRASLRGSEEAELSRARFGMSPRRQEGGPRPVTGGVGTDALHKAVQAGNINGLEAALESGLDANARDGRGWTALMHAAEKGYVLMVGPLLKSKADPDVRAVNGATALFMAAGHGHPEIIELLMKAGADPMIRGPGGETPVEVARRKYVSVEAAREKGASPALLALLAGKTWAQVEAERERLAREKAERERLAQEAREREEAERLAREKAEQERLAREEAERKRLAREKAEQERLAREEAERKRLAREAAERERLARERAERERPGREFKDCPECPEMVVVPAGWFMMGSYENSDEKPRHHVRIRKPFAVGRYEVTFAEWDACVTDGGCGGHRPDDEGWGRGRRPVINVSWDDAKAYVKWLSDKTGKEYRLLSEAEWEYVARAGTTTRYSWGDQIGHNRANCDGCGSRWDGNQTAPAGSFSANPFGLHDMHGNVWEWVEDCWIDNYQGGPSDGSAWTGGDCWFRALRGLRGGSWNYLPRSLRSASRLEFRAGSRDSDNGFRVARTFSP